MSADEKDFIRAEALRHRKNLNVHPDWAEQAADAFMAHIPLKAGVAVSLYYPRDKEIDTLPLAERLWRKGLLAALPVMRADGRSMDFSTWPVNGNVVPGKYDIPVPEEFAPLDPDIVLVPLLVFDQKGHRLGYGKGHFDATLKELRVKKPIIAVGYAYAEQACLFALPSELHDEPLDFVVTPQRVFDFRV